MSIHSHGAALPDNLHDLFGPPGSRTDQNELAVIERRRVALDHIARQMIICKMGFKGLATLCPPGLVGKVGSALPQATAGP